MKKLFFVLPFVLLLSACNEAFMQGVAEGLADRPTTVYTPAASSSNAQLEQMRQEQRRQEREAKKLERSMKDMCRASGGRWRVGRCKY